MIKIIFNYRYWLLIAIGMATFINLIAIPNPEFVITNYCLVFIYTKICAIALAYIGYRLTKYYLQKGELDELIDLLNED